MGVPRVSANEVHPDSSISVSPAGILRLVAPLKVIIESPPLAEANTNQPSTLPTPPAGPSAAERTSALAVKAVTDAMIATGTTVLDLWSQASHSPSLFGRTTTAVSSYQLAAVSIPSFSEALSSLRGRFQSPEAETPALKADIVTVTPVPVVPVKVPTAKSFIFEPAVSKPSSPPAPSAVATNGAAADSFASRLNQLES
ncbi:hypothetical protein KW797_01220, partial [Candidatus Parcubacteria bacterium]|nr:hypothetical protein [Candidatus Parcubacteria bacterium]